MTIAPNTSLSRYEIRSKLGENIAFRMVARRQTDPFSVAVRRV